MAERQMRVHLWEDRAAIVDRVVGQLRCRVFFYWIEPVGQEFLLFGAVEWRDIQEVCRFPGRYAAHASAVSVAERHFSKKLLGMWMASYVKEKAVELARHYRNRGDVVHKLVEKHAPVGSEL